MGFLLLSKLYRNVKVYIALNSGKTCHNVQNKPINNDDAGDH